MHQHPARHVRDEEIIAVAVAKPRGPRECPLLRFGIGVLPATFEWIFFCALLVLLPLAALNIVPRVSSLAASLLLYHFAPFEQLLVWTSFTSLGGLTLPMLALAIFAFARTPRWRDAPSWEYRWPIVLVQLLLSLQYLLPGLVKLHVSGFRWFGPENIAKETTRIAAVWQPDWSQLIITNRSIAAGVGAFALAIQLLFPLAVFFRRARWILIPAAFVAHVFRAKMWGLYFLSIPLLLLFVDWNAIFHRLAVDISFDRTNVEWPTVPEN